MNSRERVLTALAHKEPDRVPLDFGAGAATGIVAVAHNRLLKHLGMGSETKIWHPWMQWAVQDPEVVARLEIDCLNVTPLPMEWRRERLVDGSHALLPASWNPVIEADGARVQMYRGHRVARMPADGYWFDPIYRPLANATIEDLDDFNWMAPSTFYLWPDVDHLDELVAGVGDTAKFWSENSDKALVAMCGVSVWDSAQGLRGYENFAVDLLQNQKFAVTLMNKLADANIEFAKRYCDEIKDYAQVIVMAGEDLGGQGRMLMRPDIFRELVLPPIRRTWEAFRQNTDAYLFLHACGCIEPVLDDLIDAGVDIINPVQIGAGMDAVQLKEKYGKRVTFWGGGVDTQTTLPYGTPEDVAAEVRGRIKVLAPGGGFVFAAEQTIQAEVTPENIVAMYGAARRHGTYPIGGNP